MFILYLSYSVTVSGLFQGLGDKMSNASNSRCSSPAYGVLSDEENQPSGKTNIVLDLGLLDTILKIHITNI